MPNDWTCYCIHIRVTLKEGKGDQPPPSHTWNRSLIANILQEACPGDQIREVVVLVPGEAVLFFRRCSLKEGLLYNNGWDVDLGLSGPVSWAGRIAQVEATITIIQEGCQAITDTIMEMKVKSRGPGCPQWSRGSTQSSAATCNIDNWMWGLDESASKKEVGRTDDIYTHN